ncbi:hypothetical protein BDY19DRAFT_991145 [Irpex rosettiformis]|uniref:Uncharacterized protein n=1 Tax=Irpex rosettiformis TaxID=378272 RepID=A0ACB8UAW7_9APHY|nr:hypothetical protein BDY19DRAFT_991145 [Irpex rosettiformis]
MAPYYHQIDYSQFMDHFVTVISFDKSDANISQQWQSFILRSKCEGLNEAIGMAPHPDPERPPYIFRDVSAWPESTFDDSKITIAMYPTSDDAFLAYELDEKSKGEEKTLLELHGLGLL